VTRFHYGIDIAAPEGSPIMAAMQGTVLQIGSNSNYGKYIILGHSGFQTLYGHLSRVLVAKGTRVGQGQKIGEMGNTGYSTGTHLHFTIIRTDSMDPVDPLRYLH
jgi:murein DD-endopeptidase MepM/ murein hydrolase activator NlpD